MVKLFFLEFGDCYGVELFGYFKSRICLLFFFGSVRCFLLGLKLSLKEIKDWCISWKI